MFDTPKRDLIFLPGAGGHFIFGRVAKLLGDNKLIGESPDINEYTYEQSSILSNLTLNSKKEIIRGLLDDDNQHALGEVITYLNNMVEKSNYSCYNSIDNRDIITQRLGEVVNPETREDILNYSENELLSMTDHLQFGEYLIRKQKVYNFSLDDEQELFGKQHTGFFYSTLHDIIFSKFETKFGFSWDIGHIPYHKNCFYDIKNKNIGDYKYVSILSGDSCIYTEALREVKHMGRLKKDYSKETHAGQTSTILKNNNRSLAYVSDNVRLEAEQFDITSSYSETILYKNLIVKNQDLEWSRLFSTFGLFQEYLDNKEMIHDAVHDYHKRNIELLSEFFTSREINKMINAFS